MKTRTRAVVATILLGIGYAAQEVSREAPGVGFPLVAVVGVVLVIRVAKPSRSGTVLFLLALLFASLLCVRASPVLQCLDLSAAVGLAILAASYSQGGDVLATTARAWVWRFSGSLSAIPAGVHNFDPGSRAVQVLRPSLRLTRAVLVSGVLLVVFGAVLASADAVFARTFAAPLDWDLDLASIVRTVALSLLAALGAATLLAYATATPQHDGENPAVLGLRLSATEWIAGLATITLLFAVFVIFQLGYLFGGERQIAVPGMTYSEYARSGFFQMVLAAVLTLLLIGSAWIAWARQASGPPSLRRAFTWLSSSLLLLNLVVLASAFTRLTLYEDAFGWTRLRFIVHTIILWLAVFLLMYLAAILAGRTAQLTAAAAALSVIVLLMVNAINPDAFIAERNLERYSATGKLDLHYLSALSADAAPALVARMDEVPEREGRILGSLACQAVGRERPWYSWNLGTARGIAAVEGAGLERPDREAGPGPSCVLD